MGGGGYSISARHLRAETSGYYTKSAEETFSARNISKEMNPFNITLRESRDSEEHPESFPIIIALDVTGSMGRIPHDLLKTGLPRIMESIIRAGIQHPQVLFLAIGDHECDQAPLQVGQFESSDELLDHWLTSVYIEGGGGGNAGESYALAWLFASRYTETDSFVKRGRKGVLITIGDEPTLDYYSDGTQRRIFGDGIYSNMRAAQLLNDAMKTYECYHINTRFTMSGRREHVINGWRQLIVDHLLIADSLDDIPVLISETVKSSFFAGKQEKVITDEAPLYKTEITEDITSESSGTAPQLKEDSSAGDKEGLLL